MLDAKSWNFRKIKTMHEVAAVMRFDRWAIWAEKGHDGDLYYDCYRGHVFLKRCVTAEEARQTCMENRGKFNAYFN